MAQAGSKSGYIINPWADLLFLIGSPLVALVLGLLAAIDGLSLLKVFIVISPAHLFLVVYRSHGNKTVFNRYPWRFTLVPVALFLAAFFSTKVFRLLFFVTLLWDIHHGYMQTFGIGRIYDAKQGNDAKIGRRLDIGINVLLYGGPLVAGAGLLRYVAELENFDVIQTLFFSDTLPAFVDVHHGHVMWATIAVAAVGMTYYVFRYYQFAKQGYRVSPQKVALFVVTAGVSLWAWGFNPFGKAFFIMNIFHAMQYFALIWWSERKPLSERLGLAQRSHGMALTLAIVLLPTMVFGIVAMSVTKLNPAPYSVAYAALCFVTVVEAMHYWWDGFIWSVRRKEVPGIPAAKPIAPS